MHDSNDQKICAEKTPLSPCSLEGGHCLIAKLAELFNGYPGCRLSLQRYRDEFCIGVAEPCGESWILAFRAKNE